MKKIITLLLAGIMLFSVTGCSDKNSSERVNGFKDTDNYSENNLSDSSPYGNESVKVWGTYSTAKIMIDKNLNDNYKNIDLGQKLNVSLAKNEKEMAQLVITTTKDISSYDVIVNDLSSGDNVFSKDNIEVFHQKSINVDVKTSGNHNEKYPVGLTPDCIIPLSVAKNYKENKISADSNQPVSFEFTAPGSQASGIYEGTFIVKADEQSFEVPVTLEVWNYALPEGTMGKSCMLIYQSELFYGEMDSSDEMYIAYFEELLKNKMNAWHVPYTAVSPDKMAESVVKYWNYENFNSFGMPDLQNGIDIDYNGQKEYLLALGRKSTEDMILFDKAYFYHTIVDEPYAFPEKKAKVNTIIENINDVFEDVISQLDTEGIFDGKPEFKENMTKSIKNIPQIVTSYYDETYDGSNLTYCPPIQFIDTDEQRANLLKHKNNIKATKDVDVDTWIYTCNNPVYPYPTTHIDDYLIGSRIMRWMQKSYDMPGYLSWSVDQYSKVIPFKHQREEINPYLDPQRVLGPGDVANGDGYLFYPGKKYRSSTPYTCIRMKSLRDGQDDYDALCLLENKYKEFAKFYSDNTIDADKSLKYVYDNLFTGSVYNSDDEVFYRARKIVAEMIENSALNEKLVYNAEINGDNLDVTIYANKGYKIELDGNALSGSESGQGMKYTKSIPLSQFSGTLNINVSMEGYVKTYVVNLGRYQKATDFNNNTNTDIFEFTETNTAEISGGTANFTVNSVKKKNPSADRRYKTGFYIKTSIFDTTLDNINRIYFDILNKTDKPVDFKIYLYVSDPSGQTKGFKKECKQVKLLANQKITLKFDRIYDIEFSKIKETESLFFEFDNTFNDGNGADKLFAPRYVSISDIYYVNR